MFLDLVVVAILSMATFLGYRKGFARQIVALVAIVAVYFLATPVAAVVRLVIFQRSDVTFPGVEVATLAIAGVLVFIGVWALGRLFAATITAISESVETIDAILGAVVGGVKGILVTYLVLCGMVYAETPLGNTFPALGSQMESSFAVAGARQWNIITTIRYPELSDLRDAMLAASEDPTNEAIVNLAQNEDFQSVLGDDDLMKAAEDKDYSTLLSDERVLRLLADEDFRTLLTETDWEEMIDD